MRWLLLLALCACACADNYPRQPGIDVQHYIFRVTLRDDSNEIAGETTVRVRVVQAGPSPLALDLADPMQVDAVTSQGAAVTFEHTAGRLTLPLSAPAG